MIIETFGVSLSVVLLCVLITGFGGLVKGVVGFALPMVMISGLSSILPAPTALAALILATLVANLTQAMRQGLVEAMASLWKYRRIIGSTMVMIFVSAPLVTILPGWAMFLVLGVPIVIFAAMQLLGRQLIVPAAHRNLMEYTLGISAGFIGGISGVWGPPIIAYLLSFDVPKVESVRVQGVAYGLGSVVLGAAHLRSGVLNAETLPLSALLVVPAMLGMWLGFSVQDRLDAHRFRQATLVILMIAGLNLVRRGLAGMI